MMPPRRTNPRAEYRLRQSQRVQESVSLAEKFPRLKGLTVNLAYFDSEGVNKNSEMKYKVNVNHAKSMFCFVCQSGESVGGDFDLRAGLAKGGNRTCQFPGGELGGQGMRKKANLETGPCS